MSMRWGNRGPFVIALQSRLQGYSILAHVPVSVLYLILILVSYPISNIHCVPQMFLKNDVFHTRIHIGYDTVSVSVQLRLQCSTVQVLWSFVFKSFHFHWVLSRRVVELLFGWRNWCGKHYSHIWNLIPLCLMRTVWRERNSRTFEDATSTPDQLLGNFVNSLFDWSRIWGFTTAKTVTEFAASWHSAYSHINLL